MNCIHVDEVPDQFMEGWVVTLEHRIPGTTSWREARCHRWIGSSQQLDMPTIEEIIVLEARLAFRAITELENR